MLGPLRFLWIKYEIFFYILHDTPFSIKKLFLKNLSTNNKKSKFSEKDLEKDFSTKENGNLSGYKINRGELFGEFNLGSTIVLIFEAPKNFEFNVSQSEKVFYGNQLGSASF